MFCDDMCVGEIEVVGFQVYYFDFGFDWYVYEIFQNLGCFMFGGDGICVLLLWFEIDVFSKLLSV